MSFVNDEARLAEFEGWCGLCSERIVPDIDTIVLVDGEWAHDFCADIERPSGGPE